MKRIRIGFLSRLLPEKDGIAIYSENLMKNTPCDFVRIGSLKSKADYNVDFKSIRLKSELSRIITKEKIDLLHIQHNAAYYSKLANLNIISALRQKVPVVTTLHEVHYSQQSIRDAVLSWIEKEVTKKSHKVIVHTRGQKEYLMRKYGVSNVEMIFMGLAKKPMHKRKGNNVLFFGFVAPGKGIEYAVKAMDLVEGYNLRIAGHCVDKKYGARLGRLIKNKNNVELILGWASEEEKARHYRWADMCIYPYVWAPYQSAAIHDALAYGIPVVVAKTGAVWEIPSEFRCGAIVRPKSIKSVAGGVIAVDKYYKKYQKGIENYRKLADWRVVGKSHKELYEKAVLSS